MTALEAAARSQGCTLIADPRPAIEATERAIAQATGEFGVGLAAMVATLRATLRLQRTVVQNSCGLLPCSRVGLPGGAGRRCHQGPSLDDIGIAAGIMQAPSTQALRHGISRAIRDAMPPDHVWWTDLSKSRATPTAASSRRSAAWSRRRSTPRLRTPPRCYRNSMSCGCGHRPSLRLCDRGHVVEPR